MLTRYDLVVLVWLLLPRHAPTFTPTTTFLANAYSLVANCYVTGDGPGCADGLQSGDPDPDGSEQAKTPVADDMCVLFSCLLMYSCVS